MKDICQNCHKHKATLKWVGDSGGLALAHGFHEDWCECCSLKAQLEHAREMAAKIPGLEKELILAETQCAIEAKDA